jgi:hypothetical protein
VIFFPSFCNNSGFTILFSVLINIINKMTGERLRWLNYVVQYQSIGYCRGKGMNLQVPYKEGNFLTSCATTSFSRRTLLHVLGKVTQYLFSSFVSNVL